MRILPFVLTALTAVMAPLRGAGAAEPAIRDDVRRLFRQLDTDRSGEISAHEVSREHARLYRRLLRTADLDSDGQLILDEFDYGLTPRRPAKATSQKQPTRLPGSEELLLLVALMDVNADGIIRLAEVPDRLQPFYLRVEQRIGKNENRQIRVRDLAQSAPRVSQIAVAAVERLGLDVELELSLLPEKNYALVRALERPPRPGDRLSDPQQAEETFQLLDADGDGQIVYQEIPGQFAGRFDRLLRRADADGDGRVSREEFGRMARRVQTIRGMDRMSSGLPGDSEMMSD